MPYFPRALLLGAEYLKCIDYLSGEQVNSNIFDVDVGPALRTYSPLFHIVFEALVTESMTKLNRCFTHNTVSLHPDTRPGR